MQLVPEVAKIISSNSILLLIKDFDLIINFKLKIQYFGCCQ